jgi:hypothetical protein
MWRLSRCRAGSGVVGIRPARRDQARLQPAGASLPWLWACPVVQIHGHVEPVLAKAVDRLPRQR